MGQKRQPKDQPDRKAAPDAGKPKPKATSPIPAVPAKPKNFSRNGEEVHEPDLDHRLPHDLVRGDRDPK